MNAVHSGFPRALEAARAGDNEAFLDLWRMTQPALHRYLRITVPHVADEVSAATWVRVVPDLRRVSADERDFRAVLARIARDETAVRRRVAPRRPTAILDSIRLDAARAGVGAGRAALVAGSLTSDTAVGLVARLPADVAEMVGLRVVLGLDAGVTAGLLGVRPGSVIVAVHSGLRRTSNLLGASAYARATAPRPRRPAAPPSPWALDRMLDRPLGDGAAGPGELDPAIRAMVVALTAPGDPGDRGSLRAGLAIFERRWHRTQHSAAAAAGASRSAVPPSPRAAPARPMVAPVPGVPR